MGFGIKRKFFSEAQGGDLEGTVVNVFRGSWEFGRKTGSTVRVRTGSGDLVHAFSETTPVETARPLLGRKVRIWPEPYSEESARHRAFIGVQPNSSPTTGISFETQGPDPAYNPRRFFRDRGWGGEILTLYKAL